MLDLSIKGHKMAYDNMCDWVLNKATGIGWNAALRKDELIETVPHNSRPCYGELRRYGPESTRPQDYQPGDLPSPIKKCDERMAVAIRLPFVKDDPRRPLIDLFFSTDSPWRAGFDFDQLEWITTSTGNTKGFVMNSGDFKPTVFVNALINLRNYFIFGTQAAPTAIVQKANQYGMSFKTAYLMSQYINLGGYLTHMAHSYVFHFGSSPRAFLKGETQDLDNGKTWGQLVDYNRPDMQMVFFDQDAERKAGYPMFFKKNFLGEEVKPGIVYKADVDFEKAFAAHLVEIENTLDES